MKERLGSQNYWRRRNFLFKFDDWTEWGGKRREMYPWYWGFDEIKDRKYGYFRTTKRIQELLRFVTAYAQLIEEQHSKDPKYQPPEAFLKIIFWLKPIFDRLRPEIEAKMAARERNDAKSSAAV